MKSCLILTNPTSKRGAHVGRRVEQWVRDQPGVTERWNLRWIKLADLESQPNNPADRMVVIGGDGTVNIATQHLSTRGILDRTELAVVPAGTGNNLCRGLGIPLQTEKALPLAFSLTPPRTIDVVQIVDENSGANSVMVQTSSLGFAAHIAGHYDRLRRYRAFRATTGVLGPHVYRALALAGIKAQKRRERRGERLLEAEIVLPDETLNETALAVFVGNERSLGGNFIPCPRAELDDGLLDVCVVRAGVGVSYIKILSKAAKGKHLEPSLSDAVVYRQTRGPIKVRLSETMPILVDGDLPLASDRFRFELLPRRLRIVAER